MPTPLSVMVATAWAPSRAMRAEIELPGGEYLALLLSRFANTCAMRVASASMKNASRRRAHVQRVPPGFDERPARLDGHAQGDGEIQLLFAQFQAALRDARNVQQVVDEPHELLQLALEQLTRARGRGGVGLREPQNFDGIADGRERIAQLVSQGGEELVLAAMGVAQRFEEARVVDGDGRL